MKSSNPYHDNTERYDSWFDNNPLVYAAELKAVRSLLPKNKERGVELGAGTGRFAVQLGIKIGIEPSEKMGMLAQKRGVSIIRGVAEDLPLHDAAAELILMVTVICFVRNIDKIFAESFLVLTE